jgi:hypothetical protein
MAGLKYHVNVSQFNLLHIIKPYVDFYIKRVFSLDWQQFLRKITITLKYFTGGNYPLITGFIYQLYNFLR